MFIFTGVYIYILDVRKYPQIQLFSTSSLNAVEAAALPPSFRHVLADRQAQILRDGPALGATSGPGDHQALRRPRHFGQLAAVDLQRIAPAK